MIEDPLKARGIILGLGEQRHESRRLEPARDASEHRGDRWVAEVGDDGSDRLRATAFQARGDHVRLITHLLGDCLDVFPGVSAHPPNGVGIEGAGHCRVVHARRARDVLQGHGCPTLARVACPHPAVPPCHY